MKRSSPLRRTPLRPGTKPLKTRKPLRTRTRLKAINPERRARMELRQFGGLHGELVRCLPCCNCGQRPPSERAHTTARGMGGAHGAWWHLVPLCRECHALYDGYRGDFADREFRRGMELRAFALAWESWDRGLAPSEPPVSRPPSA